jgi:hypothetical protein
MTKTEKDRIVGELGLDAGKINEGQSNQQRTGPNLSESALWPAWHWLALPFRTSGLPVGE